MSEYTVVQLQINDPGCLKETLKELGYPFVEHQEAQRLEGYQGDKRDQRAHIIVQRQNVGTASNDVGFLKKSDGTWDLIISEFDRRSGTQAENFMKKFNHVYAKQRCLKEIHKKGWTVTSKKTTKDGKLKIKVML